MMTEQELNHVLSAITSLPAETEIVEFKEAKSGYDFDKIGKYFSALSNEANLKGKFCAWLVFGVENTKHRIVGSNYRPSRKDLDSLKKEIGDKTTQNISFIEIYELHKPEGRVIMFQIPAAPQGIPVAYEGFYYGRAGESLVALNIEKIERIRNQAANRDWSRKIIPDATFNHLDKDAIRKAREQYKLKNQLLAKEADTWTDEVFLDKAKITLDGKITNTAILLLGKNEASPLLSPAVAQISWILKYAPEGYEHFHTPFILTVDKALACIRNTKYRYMADSTTLFPQEVTRYDEWVMRETLHNCVAHQDYSKSSRIIILEYENRLIFENAGSFIPGSVEEVIRFDRPQPYYRNRFLVEAMVNLNMIDTIGSGIKRIFTTQRERFFPMPTYDISNKNHTEVILYGELINVNYSRFLFSRPELNLDDVILLDKVQKKQPVSETEIQHLRDLKLVAGMDYELQVAGNYVKISYQEYKQMILDLLRQKGSATREDIVKLIMPTLSPDVPVEKRQKKISNIIVELSTKDKKIVNISKSIKSPVWALLNKEISNKKDS
ncbi:MAG: putative DNA binding domain-containing protein [Dysgonamonadaceae bacterium]|jgi:ATP-dependent DNA helicase RecG|nr:putative DNA binding domain-containing protein [Dysgonamonadaceae bacterium]